jgi:hypothetical protein
VQLRVEKHIRAMRFEFRPKCIAVAEERFVSDFEPHAERRQHFDELARAREIGYVECDDEFGLGRNHRFS